MTTIPMPLTPHEIDRALVIARKLAHAGVPLFLGSPCMGSTCTPECQERTRGRGLKSGFHLPLQWEHSPSDPAIVDSWQPGWALCAIGGYTVDFLDIDPRNGGAESMERLQAAGMWPQSYGCQATPSGGRHEVIAPLRIGKGGLRWRPDDESSQLGIDLQGGRPDGTGRGFVFLAPTERASKVDGVRRAYRWLCEPDLSKIDGDTSGAGLAGLLPVRRTPVQTSAQRPWEIFIDLAPERADQLIHDACRRVCEHAQRGWSGFRETLCLDAAYTLGGLVGAGYLAAGDAEHRLTMAIVAAGHTPDDDDLTWIDQGITEGSRRPIWVQQPRPAIPLTPKASESPPFNLPEEFWQSRRVLSEIRAAAHARARSADAVLGVVLARLSSLLPGDLRVDTGVAMPAALNFFSILMGTRATGKTTSAQIAESLFPIMAFADCEDNPIGSGQGIAAAYGELVDGKFEQSRVKAMFHADEGESLLKLAKQPDNVTMATLRTCWSGGTFGQRNATAGLSRVVSNYSMGLWVGLQPTHAAELFSAKSVDDGTLDRFVWFATTDPSIPRARCTSPPPPVSWDLASAWNAHSIDIPVWLRDELYARDVAVQVGEIVPEAGRGHEPLIRVKTACLLAILDSRHHVTVEDWQLSAVVLDTSCAVAQTVRDSAAQRARDSEAAGVARRLRLLDAEAQHAERQADSRLAKLVGRAVARVTERPGISRSDLIRLIARSTDRELGAEAVETAAARGLIEVRDGENCGSVLHPK